MQVQANGISMHYTMDGPVDAPVVVLGHSLSANLGMWDSQMHALAQYRVLRYDTRGHGATEAPAADYTLALLADDLFGLLDSLGLDQVHFVGLSMGGMIGQVAAVTDQSRFLSLSLCDTTSTVPEALHSTWHERIETVRADGVESLVTSTIDRWFSTHYQVQASIEVDKIRAMIRSTAVEGYCGCCYAIMGLNITDQLPAITVPTLLIVGEDDPATPVAAHQVINQRIAGSELVVIPDALHLSNVEQRDAFNTVLCGFLARHA
jgi:3-oxoadipate enol-lactonase